MKVMPVYGETPWKIRIAGTVCTRRRSAAKQSHAKIRQSIPPMAKKLPEVIRTMS